MANPRQAQPRRALSRDRKSRQRQQELATRRLQLEMLEERRLLTAGLNLFSLVPNSGVAINNSDTLNVAPRELKFVFADGQAVNPASIANGIVLVRSGGDNSFDAAGIPSPLPDVTIAPGFIGPGDTAREVIMRFASNLPDDLYRVTLVGTGLTPLTDASTPPVAFNGGADQQIVFSLDLGTKVQAVVPQPITRDPVTKVLAQNANTIEVYFDSNELSSTARTNPAFYRLISSNTSAIQLPQSVIYTADPVRQEFKATLTFATAIPAGTFKLEVGTSTEVDDTLNLAQHYANSMTAAVQAFIGDNPTLTAANQANDIDIYRFDLQVASGLQVTVVPTGGATLDAAIRVFDKFGNPVGNVIDSLGVGGTEFTSTPLLNPDTYYVAVSSHGNTAYDPLVGLPPALVGTTTGAYSINVTFSSATAVEPSGDLANSSFDTASNGATPLGVLGLAGRTISAAIQPQTYTIQFPGAGDAPGDRNIPFEEHITTTPGLLPDPTTGVETYTYDFQTIYGYTPQGQPLFNAITEGQKQRAREVLELYSRYLGVQFQEVPSATIADMTIATGDPRAVAPTISTGTPATTGDGVNGIAGTANIPGTTNTSGVAVAGVNGQIVGAANSIPPFSVLTAIVITTAQPHNLTSGARVKVQGVTGLTNANGVWTISVVDSTHFALVGSLQNFFSQTYLGGGTWQLLDVSKGVAIMNALVDWGSSEYGGQYFQTAFHEIGHLLGLGDNFEAPALTMMGGGETPSQAPNLNTAEPVFPGDADIVYGQAVHRPESRDIDLYQFNVTENGVLRAETIAERMQTSSLLNTVLTLYKETGSPNALKREVIARNDDYFSSDSFLELRLTPGTYYVAVTAAGNTEFDPTIPNTGFGGRSQGKYDLKLQFNPDGGTSLTDTSTPANPQGVAFDGDGDGNPGGKYEFWFQSNTAGNTAYVDKSPAAQVSGSPGSITNPFTTLSAALAFAGQNTVVRVVGNGGTDGNLSTAADAKPYLVGYIDPGPTQSQQLPDGGEFRVPKNVTVMIDAGAVFKLRGANLNAGSTSGGGSDGGAIQVLGTPFTKVQFTSYSDDTIGGDSNPTEGPSIVPQGGNWGGIVFRDDSDRESSRIFLNYVNNAVLTYGGGSVLVDSVQEVYNPIHMATARPYLAYNVITKSADAAVSADPNAFDDDGIDKNGQRPNVAYDDRHIGPRIHDNTLLNNTVNGMFIRVRTLAGTPLDLVDLATRWDDTDIVHVVSENVEIAGTPGGSASPGPDRPATTLTDARLRIDPGVIVKLSGARIEAQVSSQFIAEGTTSLPIVFTSLKDDKFGAGGTFDTNSDAAGSAPAPGQWGGLIFNAASSASIDRAKIFYGGGNIPIEGNFDQFNVIEISQADVRIANSDLEFNADGGGGNSNRNGRGFNVPATIFVRGAQPIIVNNIIRNNGVGGPAISINANALVATTQGDWGRSTGAIDRVISYDDNKGPLVRGNRLVNNQINGMDVRGGTLTTETVWDDVDIAHILRSDITVLNHQVNSGLRLQSSQKSSLVVKLLGTNAGFTANGVPLDISDRIGGTIQVIGQPGFPVVLTSLFDDTVSAGLTPDGLPLFDTNNDNAPPLVGPEIFNPLDPTLIDDDIIDPTLPNPAAVVGHFEVRPVAGGNFGSPTITALNPAPPPGFIQVASVPGSRAAATAQGRTLLFTNQNLIAAFLNYVNVGGATPTTLDLNASTITMPPTFVSDDLVVSEGNFAGANGTVNWHVETRMDDGNATAFNTLTFTSTTPLGSLQFINFFNQNITQFGPDGGDFIQTTGTPGLSNFLVNTYDDSQRIGFSHGGSFLPGTGLTNATYSGWSADTAANLQAAITGGTPVFSVPGNINTTTLPAFVDPTLGPANGLGDASDAMAWTVDPLATTATITTFVTLIPKAAPSAGDWRSIVLDKYSNDRNVAEVLPLEGGYIGTIDANRTPQTAQLLGNLAPNQKSGDGNRRLGFEVNGTIAADNPADVDVYSFTADGGTEIWIDLDKTSFGLDAMVELVDANGNFFARATDTNPNALLNSVDNTGLTNNGMNVGDPLGINFNKDPYNGRDTYTTNPHDGIMRIKLPGSALNVPWFIRVRSQPKNAEVGNNLNPGLTSGAYQLQIRLQQKDEKPGSTVKFADIRYATNGIDVRGLPNHSPLSGDSVEADDTLNNNFDPVTGAGPQNIGNLLRSDKNTLSVGGQISSLNDVDWYRFDLTFDLLQFVNGYTSNLKTWSTIFDLDYGDGLSRANATISVYDQTGRLIFIGRDSDIQDDQASAPSDLSAATLGKLDPYIGPVQLPAGNPGQLRTYYVAVSNNRQLPAVLDQTYRSVATATQVRVEPVDSVARAAIDPLEKFYIGAHTGGETAEFPDNVYIEFNDPVSNQPTSTLIDTKTAQSLQANVKPFTLADVNLFVSDFGNLYQVNALSGNTDVSYITPVGLASANNASVSDLAFRSDGLLYSYEDLAGTNGTAGRLSLVNPANGTSASVGNDNIPQLAANAPETIASDEVGALAFTGDVFPNLNSTTLVYAVHERNAQVVPPVVVCTSLTPPTPAGCTPGAITPAPAVFADASRLYIGNPANGSAAVVQGQPFGRVGVANDYINVPLPATGSTDFQLGTTTLDLQFQAAVNGVAGIGTVVNFLAPDPALAANAPPKITVTPAAGGTPGRLDITLNPNPAFSLARLNMLTGAVVTASIDIAASAADVAGDAISFTFAKRDFATVAGSNGDINIFQDTVNPAIIHVELNTGAPIGATLATAQDMVAALGGFSIQNVPGVTGLTATQVTPVLPQNPIVATLTFPATLQLSGGSAGGTTMQQLVAAINSTVIVLPNTAAPSTVARASISPAAARAIDTQQIITGGQQFPLTITLAGARDSVGLTTGLSFGSDVHGFGGSQTLYGVTDQGWFMSDINYQGFGGGPGGQQPAQPASLKQIMLPDAFNPNVMVPATFTGLTRGPQNMQNGFYADMLFATTGFNFSSGSFQPSRLVAMDTSGNLMTVFDTVDALGNPGQDGVVDSAFVDLNGVFDPTGLAFSPFDFNLWHPTFRQQNVPGHDVETNVPTMTTNDRQLLFPASGRVQDVNMSLYFGYEPVVIGSPGPGYQTDSYELYDTTAELGNANLLSNEGQLGELSATSKRDLSNSGNFTNNYNLPGGAKGSLITDKFSLSTAKSTDKPTIYFDYFLDTADTNIDRRSGPFMTDSARVYVGPFTRQDPDSGNSYVTWDLLATNNDVLDDPSTGQSLFNDPFYDGELPTFVSSAVTDLPASPRQQVQPLFDSTGVWRQARVDLSRYAGMKDLQIRFDFTTAGAMTDLHGQILPQTRNDQTDVTTAASTGNEYLYENVFGDLTHERRGQNNDFEGFYVDNINIGMAERGEMVINAPVDTSFFSTPTPRPLDPETPVPTQVTTGPYQLEIRRGTEYGMSDGSRNTQTPILAIDTNDRLIPDKRQATVDPAAYVDNFDSGAFNPLILWTDKEDLPWTIQDTTASGGTGNAAVSGAIGNGQRSALEETLITGAGNLTFTFSVSSAGPHTADVPIPGRLLPPGFPPPTQPYDVRGDFLNLYIDGRIAADINGFSARWTGDPTTGVGPSGTAVIPVAAGRHTFRWEYRKDEADSAGLDRAFIDNISFPLPQVGVGDLYDDKSLNDPTNPLSVRPPIPPTLAPPTTLPQIRFIDTLLPGFVRTGDQNLDRQQGHLQIEQNFIYAAAQVGLLVDGGARDPNTNNSPLGSLRNLPTLSTDRLVPGVTLANNVVANSGQAGIRFTGDNANVSQFTGLATDPVTGQLIPRAGVPFGKIVNNTIFGGLTPNGIGIDVFDNAGPTLLNNIVSGLNIGISVDFGSRATTVLGENLFASNNFNTSGGLNVGTNAILLQPTDPLFVDPANRNFYLQAGSQAIDSSINTLADRPGITSVKSAIGVPQSPILAPDRDSFGQLRVDDPNQFPPPGLGQNIFKDRGAVERADFARPTGTMIDPPDNDAAGRDRNPALNDLTIRNEVLTQFVLSLPDVGIGIDDVSAGKSTNYQLASDGVLLTENVDYVFRYNATTNAVTFLPATGSWPSNHTYTITVNNGLGGVQDLAGNLIQANRPATGIPPVAPTQFNIFVGNIRDYGDAPAPYPTATAQNGAANDVNPAFHLGPTITEETDALINSTATADGGDDGVKFIALNPPTLVNPNLKSMVVVNASTAGKLDAWIDLNGDGDWNDAGEKIISNKTLVAGDNSIAFTLGVTSTPHISTFARFRLTALGTVTPDYFGAAGDGEVEDYKVQITGPAYKNTHTSSFIPPGFENLDVSNDGHITPHDALVIINYLNFYTPPRLVGQFVLPPVSPPFASPAPIIDPTGGGVSDAGLYLDTDGDGFLTPTDVLIIINYLNSLPPGASGEGESSSPSLSTAAATSSAAAAASMAIPPVLLAAPNIVLETRDLLPQNSSTATPSMFTSEQDLLDLGWLAAQHNQPTLLASALDLLSEKDDQGASDPPDDSEWDNLLTNLAGDSGRA